MSRREGSRWPATVGVPQTGSFDLGTRSVLPEQKQTFGETVEIAERESSRRVVVG